MSTSGARGCCQGERQKAPLQLGSPSPIADEPERTSMTPGRRVQVKRGVIQSLCSAVSSTKRIDSLIRIGRPNDAGYVVNSRSVGNSDRLIGLGINDDSSFEEDFYSRRRAPVVNQRLAARAKRVTSCGGVARCDRQDGARPSRRPKSVRNPRCEATASRGNRRHRNRSPRAHASAVRRR